MSTVVCQKSSLMIICFMCLFAEYLKECRRKQMFGYFSVRYHTVIVTSGYKIIH